MRRIIITLFIVSFAVSCRDKPEPAPPPAEEEQVAEPEKQEPAPDDASACSDEAIEGFFEFARDLGRLLSQDDEGAFWTSEREATYDAWRRPLPR